MNLKILAFALNTHGIRSRANGNGTIEINGHEFTIVSGERSYLARGETLSMRFRSVSEFIFTLRNDRMLFVRDPRQVAQTYTELLTLNNN